MTSAEAKDEPDVINVLGLPEAYLRKIYKETRNSQVHIVCDAKQYALFRKWQAEDERSNTEPL
jgi:hypothetical protein